MLGLILLFWYDWYCISFCLFLVIGFVIRVFKFLVVNEWGILNFLVRSGLFL